MKTIIPGFTMTNKSLTRYSLKTPNAGVALILISTLFIGLTTNTAKIAYQEGANPVTAVIFRCVIGMFGLGIYLLIKHRSDLFNKRALLSARWTGLFQLLLSFFMLASVAYIDVGVAILIIFLHPFLIALVTHFNGGTPLTMGGLACFVTSIFGLALVLVIDLDILNTTGVILAFLGALSATAMILAVAKSVTEVGVMPANFFMMFWASIYIFLIALILKMVSENTVLAFPTSSIGWVGLIGTGIAFTLGYLLFFAGASVIGPTRAALLTIIEPVVTVMFAIVLVGEWMTPFQWAGIACVVLSLFVLEKTGVSNNQQCENKMVNNSGSY